LYSRFRLQSRLRIVFGATLACGPDPDRLADIIGAELMPLHIRVQLHPRAQLGAALFPAREVLLETGPLVDRFG
jgi:hypothetical protein